MLRSLITRLIQKVDTSEQQWNKTPQKSRKKKNTQITQTQKSK